jgi:hypothetical protein
VVPAFLIALNSMLDTRYRDETALRLVTSKNILAALIVIIGVMINETMVATAQEKQMNTSKATNIDKQKIIVTWLETNATKTSSDTPVISINSKDFWKMFEPLVIQLTINGSTSSLE